jgi:dethiobiotin synthetase
MSNAADIPPFDFAALPAPALPRLRGLFVTGADTGVGKTLIAGAIARSLRRAGRRVEVFKPVATGCKPARGQLVSQDAEFLAACSGSQRMLSEICPVRYRQAVAPNVAAELERRPVDLELIFHEYRRLSEGGPAHAAPPVVVEGVGGLLCPLTDDFWVIHLARAMALPLVVVARAGLGTINHTLLTLHAARSAGLRVAGVVLNRYLIDPLAGKDSPLDELERRGDVDMAMFTNPQQVEARGRVKVLTLVPQDKESSVEDDRIGKDVQFAVDHVDWERIMNSDLSLKSV